MNLLQMSLSGAVMILVIIVIRALAINKLPKKTFLVLWGVVVVRLLIPYSLSSTFSIYSLLERFATTAETANGNPAVSFAPMAPTYNVVPTPGTAATNTAAPATIDPWVPGTAATNTMAPATVDPWGVVWVIGILACAVFFAVAYWKYHKEFKASLPVDNEYVTLWLSEHRIHRNIEIRQSDRVSAPLTFGVFRPIILVPKTVDWDNLDALKYVLTHEYVHIRRFDAVTKLVLTFALCVHWFNPAVWIMYVLTNRDIELSCDEAVIREFGERTKSEYAMALIRMEETRSGLTPFCNNFSKNAIEERIVAIMKIKKTSLVALIVAVALVTGVITVFATSAEANKETALMPAETPISTDNPQTPTAKPDTSTEIPSNDIGVSSDYISAPCSKDGVEELMSIIGEIELGGLSAGMITDKEHCYNVTPLSVAAETDIKIFKFSDSCLSLALIDNEVYEICTSFGGFGFVNAVPWDYDEDGNLDLLIASSWGSGLHRSEISVFNTKTKESIVIYHDPFAELFVAAGSPSFSSKNPNDLPICYQVYSANIAVEDNNLADLSYTATGVIGSVVVENGNPVFKLSPISTAETSNETIGNIATIVDRTKTEGLPYDMAEEKFFEDGDNEYYFSGIYSHYVIVHYEDGSQEDIVTALNAGRATIADLDKFEVDYIVKALDTKN